MTRRNVLGVILAEDGEVIWLLIRGFELEEEIIDKGPENNAAAILAKKLCIVVMVAVAAIEEVDEDEAEFVDWSRVVSKAGRCCLTTIPAAAAAAEISPCFRWCFRRPNFKTNNFLKNTLKLRRSRKRGRTRPRKCEEEEPSLSSPKSSSSSSSALKFLVSHTETTAAPAAARISAKITALKSRRRAEVVFIQRLKNMLEWSRGGQQSENDVTKKK